jgi:hypothetical protein
MDKIGTVTGDSAKRMERKGGNVLVRAGYAVLFILFSFLFGNMVLNVVNIFLLTNTGSMLVIDPLLAFCLALGSGAIAVGSIWVMVKRLVNS